VRERKRGTIRYEEGVEVWSAQKPRKITVTCSGKGKRTTGVRRQTGGKHREGMGKYVNTGGTTGGKTIWVVKSKGRKNWARKRGGGKKKNSSTKTKRKRTIQPTEQLGESNSPGGR